ncbi:hypothetical protein GOP47_0015268 [Adiantum capillus-veneris]|uniref:Uncharacterized protein n=1 Tax=Adiantum capillus-veneris TaxID=13818 RepID=A0A9D4UK39_ADICA|nr:hypothetical protein GOP47_0015268 [Adiantum capillus-veneris]
MAYYHPRKAFGNEDVIYKARQHEKALQERLQFVQEYKGLMRYAQFEEGNGPRASHRCLAERLHALRHQREQELLQRRSRLSAILSAEDASLKHDITTGNMNLSERRAWLLGEALALSSRKAASAPALHHDTPSPSTNYKSTNLETALCEEYDEMSTHNSKLAVRRAEAEKQRQSDNEAIRRSLYKHGLLDLQDADKQAIDILREHLYMVERLRDQEKVAVEEDMISMNKRWLEEQEALKQKHLEHRLRQSSQVRDALLCNAGGGDHHDIQRRHGIGMDASASICGIESGSEAGQNMAAEKEAEEEKQVEELRESHKREALAYVYQLQEAAARQRKEDEELEANILAHMHMQAAPRHDHHGHAQTIMHHHAQRPAKPVDEVRMRDSTRPACTDQYIAPTQLSKQEMADALQGERRRCQAAELVQQEVKRLAVHADHDWKKPTSGAPQYHDANNLDLPYPEPYYGRKAVKWYE